MGIDKEKFERLLKENRVNINSMLADLHQDEPDPPIPPDPPDIHVCEYPLPEVKKVNGWSGLGYETLAWRDVLYPVWDACADLLAKNAINFHRFFAYCSETQAYLANTVSPFPLAVSAAPREGGLYDLLHISPEYREVMAPRLKSFHDRKITTAICLGSGIKDFPPSDPRWDHSYFNGFNNINGTTFDCNRFYDDAKTISMFKMYIRNMVKWFDNEYVIWELMNEPSCSAGRIIAWNNNMIAFMTGSPEDGGLGIPPERIAINTIDDHRVKDFLDEGIWVFAHATNSWETVNAWLTREDRIWMVKYPTFILCGDGGDELKKAHGFVGAKWSKDFIHASARQCRDMIRAMLQGGGAGLDFMPALAFLDGAVPNLMRIIKHGEAGFMGEELMGLTARIGTDFMRKTPTGEYENGFGELRECAAAFTNNLPF